MATATTVSMSDALTVAARVVRDGENAPAVVGVRVNSEYKPDSGNQLTASLQLAATGTQTDLVNVARWAEHLGSSIALTPGNGYVRVRAAIRFRGVRVEVWNHLPPNFTSLLPQNLAGRCTDGAVLDPAEVLAALGVRRAE